MKTTPHITDLRTALMATLQRLGEIGREGKPLDLEQIKAQVAIANGMKGLADTLVDTARIEIEFLKVTGSERSDFLEAAPGSSTLPKPSGKPTAHQPFPVSARHRLNG